eukprot:Hpha_TRINITY_DN10094_c1_g1::TRINITY_DN10094_c1_g1_i1::g.83857::m.83857/K03671/trxA; thioredoxin 1
MMRRALTRATSLSSAPARRFAVTLVNDDEHFETLLKSHQRVAVDFYADWCGPCKLIAPVFSRLSDEGENKDVTFVKVNVDELQETAMKYNVTSIPHFVFLKGGEPIDALVGASEGKLREKVSKLLTQ